MKVSSLSNVKALTFDVFGTVVDWRGSISREIKEVGMGERACVDTASMLKQGEGLLVGNQANFMFLLHNESAGSGFTSPRPFRVNAGAIQCYTLLPNCHTMQHS